MSNTAVFVSSCDAYSDLWNPFFEFFHKYWPDCPYNIYLLSNNKIYSSEKVQTIAVKKSTTWSDEIYTALEQIKEDNLIYLQDDYFILRPVETLRLEQLIETMGKHQAGYLRLIPMPGPDTLIDDKIGIIDKGKEYITSLQAAIWKKEALLELLRKEENPWEFEKNTPKRTLTSNWNFLAINKYSSLPIEEEDYPINYFCTAVYKGKYMRKAVEICNKEGIALDLSVRPVENIKDEQKRMLIEQTPKLLKPIVSSVLKRILV